MISRGWRVVVLKPRSRLATGRVRPTGGAGPLQVPRQPVEVDIATGQNVADSLASDVDLSFPIAAYGTAADGSMIIFIVSQMVRIAKTIASSPTVTIRLHNAG